MSYLYQLAHRFGWRAQRRHNERTHSEEDVRVHLVELRNHGHT